MLPDKSELLDLVESFEGYVPVRSRRNTPGYHKRLQAAIDLAENRKGLPQHRWQFELIEAMNTADFPLLFGDSLDRDLIARYGIARPQLMQTVRKRTTTRTEAVKSFRIRGLTGRLHKVGQSGEYKSDSLDEEKSEYNIDVWGRKCDFSFKTFINDDIGAFNDMPARQADAAAATLEYFITTLRYNSSGCIAASFNNTPGATTLTIPNMETAIEAMAAQLHPKTGEPLPMRPVMLEVAPSQELLAHQIVESAKVQWVYRGTTDAGPTPLGENNVISKYGIRVIVNEWLPVVNTTSYATCWALYADPMKVPTAEVGFLKGRETPELYMLAPNMIRAGGGAVSPFEGNFETDQVFYKVRFMFGGTVLGTSPVGCYAQNGA